MSHRINSTPYEELGYIKQDEGLWRFVDITDGRDPNNVHVVGPQYPTEKALLADMQRYARESWSHDPQDMEIAYPVADSDFSVKVQVDPATGKVGVAVIHNLDPDYGMDCLIEVDERGQPTLHVSNAIGGDNVAHISATRDEMMISPDKEGVPVAYQGSYIEPESLRHARENVERIEGLARTLGLVLDAKPGEPGYKTPDSTCVGDPSGGLNFEDNLRTGYQKALWDLEFVRENRNSIQLDESAMDRISSEVRSESLSDKGLS